MSAGAIGDRSQIAQWHGLKHICSSPWPGPLCAQELCCFIESTSPIPHALQLPKAEQCMAGVSPQAFLACGSSNKASQEMNKCLLNSRPVLQVQARPFSALRAGGRARLPKCWLRCVVVFAEVSPARSPLGSPGLCVDHWLAGGLAP